jgi:hypothetical protein
MSTTANTAANIATTAANVAVQAANVAQTAASQAAVSASRGSNVTNITVINPNAAGIPGSLQFASTSNQLSASRNLVFDQNTSNLELQGNLKIRQALEAQTIQLQSAIANGNIQAETLIASGIRSLANLQVANRVTANVVSANTFVGDGSNLTGILKQNNATLTGNVSIPNVSVSGPLFAPVPLKLLVDQLALKANINSPNFTGNPTAPTLTNVSSSSNSIATTAFVQLVANTKANLSNVTLTNVSLVGNVFAPTQFANTSNTTVATTKFVQDQKINLNLSGLPTAPIPNANAAANQIATVSFARSSGAPSIILSRRTGTDVNFSVGTWVTIPFDTLDRNIAGAIIIGNNFDLLAGTYVYTITIPVHCIGSDTINSFYTRFLNVDTGFALQSISATSIGDWSTATITGTGQFTLSGTTTIALQGLQGDSPTARIDGFAGYQSGVIQFWKIA